MNTDYQSLDVLITNESFIAWVLDSQSDPKGYWDLYQKNNPDRAEEIEEAIQLVKTLNDARTLPTHHQKQKILKSIHSDITSIDYKPTKVVNWKSISKIAAMFVFILSAYFMVNTNGENQFTTNYNEIQNLILPDGSQVILNSNSSLSYSENWNNTVEREVWLEGEAYFNVNKTDIKKGNKFVVHTSDLNVTVLGTQFNVNTHKEETDVVLEEGKIDIKIIQENHSVSEKIISMIPGQKTSFNPNAKNYQVSEVNTEVYTAWKDGAVVFDGTPLSELKSIIEHNYGYKVKFDNKKLLSKKLDGKIDNPDLETLLSTLETIFNLKIQKNGKHIIIKE